MNNQKPDSELIRLLNEGDIVAFDTIYSRYSFRLYGFVVRYLKNREDAEEIVQEVFLKIWESRQKIVDYSSFNAYIFTIAYNSTITLLRKRITEKKYLSNLKIRQDLAAAPDLIDEIQFRYLDEKVHSLIERLTPRQQEIFRLSRDEKLTHEQIANKLNISANTVKNHIVATLAFLRSELDNGLIVSVLFVYLFFN